LSSISCLFFLSCFRSSFLSNIIIPLSSFSHFPLLSFLFLSNLSFSTGNTLLNTRWRKKRTSSRIIAKIWVKTVPGFF
jgi:hypothetical protein